MGVTRSTALGRRVLVEDWLSFHRDTLLVALYRSREIGGDNNGLTLAQVADLTGLNTDGDRGFTSAFNLVNSMKERPKLLKVTIDNTIVLTPRGIRWVEESPCQPPDVGRL